MNHPLESEEDPSHSKRMKEVIITSLATSLVHRVICVQPPPTLDSIWSTKSLVFVTFGDRHHLDG
jgi:hypothetical protein